MSRIDIDSLTIREVREIQAMFPVPASASASSSPAVPAAPAPHPYVLGESVIIRTVTMHFTGRIAAVYPGEIVLDEAAWIADTGRWAQALTSGVLAEVEPYPGRCIVSRGAIVDVSPWTHSLPRATK